LTARVDVIERAAADKIDELQALVGDARLEDRRADGAGGRASASDRGTPSGRSEGS